MSPPKLGGPFPTEPASVPTGQPLQGRYVTLVKFKAEHARDLWPLITGEENLPLFTYLRTGPWETFEAYQEAMESRSQATDPFLYAIIDNTTGRALGHVALSNIQPQHRSVQIGGLVFTRAMQGSKSGTEVHYLLAKHVFEDLGYRRYEWRSNSLNERSVHAAERLGFTFEGIFRQHMIIKGRNRDSTFLSMLDSEWPGAKKGFQKWLADTNFDRNGRQLATLQECREQIER